MSIPEDSPAFQDIFNMLDSDHNDEIDLNEFLHGLATLKKENEKDDEIIQHTFKILDHDEKGYVVEKDFVNIMKSRFPTLTEEKCHDLFQSADENSKGTVTYEQFAKHQKNNPVYMELSKNLRKRRLAEEIKRKEENEGPEII